MTDPFSVWSQMFAAGIEMQSTWWRGLETMQASRTVISVRTDKMRDAVRSPLNADVGEFARMLPEKVEAFGHSAEAIVRDTIAMHGAWATQMRRVSALMMVGRMPTIGETRRLVTQSTDYAVGAMTAGAKFGRDALAPVHRAATRNARRLRQAKTL